MKTNLSGCLFFLAALASAQAQVTLTFNATAIGTAGGFIAGDHVTFSFNLNSSYAGGSGDDFTQNLWQENPGDAAPLFTSFTGTGVTGALPPNYDYIYTGAFGSLEIYADTPAGLSLNGAPVTGLQFDLYPFSGIDFTPLAAPMYPTTYFANFAGNYSFVGGGYGSLTFSGLATSFDVTGFSITSGSAIPEPSTYAALGGLGALGLALLRRRRPLAHHDLR